MKKKLFKKDFPFNPKNCPFFYGWVILIVATIGHMSSIVGQTGGVTGFIEPLKQALGMSGLELSCSYMIGTLAAASILPWTGHLYDRLGPRRLGTQIFLVLGLMLFFLSATGSLHDLYASMLPERSSYILNFITITLGFFGIRYLAMGVLGFLPRSMLSKWFHEKRGIVNTISGFCVAMSSGCAPLLSSLLVENCGWQLAWQLTGVVLVIVFAPLVWCFYRDSPEQCAMRPDGVYYPVTLDDPSPSPIDSNNDFSLHDALRTRIFWLFAIGLAICSSSTTAINFHAQALEISYGLPKNAFMELFIPATILTVGSSSLTAWISRHVPLKNLLCIMMGFLIFGAIGLLIAPISIGFHFFVIGYGSSFGMYSTLVIIVWPHLFGRTHLGSITATAMGINLSASAFGPMLYSIAKAVFDTYTSAFWTLVLLGLILILLAIWTKPPQKQHAIIEV
jgi:MFS transporter, OFA family, oxalate/formate antiporter